MAPLRTAATLLLGVVLGLPTGPRAEELIRVSGTGTALGTMRRLGDAYTKATPGSQVKVLTSVGSSGAFGAVAGGALDLGISARPLKPEEYGLGLVALPFARTPFLFAAGPRSGATNLTPAEVVRIFRGEVTKWPNGERLRLVLRPRTDADTQILAGVSREIASAVETAHGREGMLLAVTNQECNEILVRTPGALGLSSLAQVRTEGLPLTLLSWNGVAPTAENLASGAYPLEKTLYLVIKAPAGAPIQRFVAFLASPAGQRILKDAGNLPLPLPPLE